MSTFVGRKEAPKPDAPASPKEEKQEPKRKAARKAEAAK